jgi:chorismate mutase
MAELEDFQKQIDQLRAKIDKIDEELVAKLNERAGVVLAVRELKSRVQIPLYDPRREEEIFDNISRGNQGPLFDDAVREIYERILHAMKDLEER